MYSEILLPLNNLWCYFLMLKQIGSLLTGCHVLREISSFLTFVLLEDVNPEHLTHV